VVLVLAAVVQMLAAGTQDVDVTGAWAVTITTPSGSASGLAILSQDGAKVTGRTAAFDRMTGTIYGDKGTIDFTRKPRRE